MCCVLVESTAHGRELLKLLPGARMVDATPKEQEVVLNERLARHLHVAHGDSVSLWVQLPSSIPRESLSSTMVNTRKAIAELVAKRHSPVTAAESNTQ